MDWYFPEDGFLDEELSSSHIGEEGAGIVEKVGEGVTNLVVGDKV